VCGDVILVTAALVIVHAEGLDRDAATRQL